MIEIIIIVAFILLVKFLIKTRKKKKSFSADEKENNTQKQEPASIIGASTFILKTERQKQSLAKKQDEPTPDSFGKMDIEVPLDYELEDTDLQEEQEEFERLGLQTGFSSDITFNEMMSVVNEVGNDQTKAAPKTGKLLYENENTDWVGQLSSFSKKNASRIASLIDLHLGRLEQPNSNVKPDDGFRGFDIGEYVG